VTENTLVNLELDVQSALEVLQVLDAAVAQYSTEHTPQRIVRLRAVLDQLDKELEKVVS
jgi:DNA-binding GntR family transcriptional regulator